MRLEPLRKEYVSGFKALFKRNETLVAAIIVAYCVVASFVSPAFFSLGTLFDLLRGSIVMGIFAVGVLLVLISGGIDVSFTAVAVFALYATTKIVIALGLGDFFAVAFVLACLIGLGLGLFNAVFIALFRLPTLIVTLGTLSLFRGFLLTFVGSNRITRVPDGPAGGVGGEAAEFYHRQRLLFTPCPPRFCSWWARWSWFGSSLYRTMLGRQIFALGGSRVAAGRAGINVVGVQFFIYGFVGLLSGGAGIIHAALTRNGGPL